MELRRIVRDLDDGVIAISMDGNIRAMNPRAVQLLGVGEKEQTAHHRSTLSV